jgi:threonyl-tRNA synthetase
MNAVSVSESGAAAVESISQQLEKTSCKDSSCSHDHVHPPKPKPLKKSPSCGEFPLELSPPPEYINHRISIFEKLKAEHNEFVAIQPRRPITVTLPDGRQMDATAWQTTPMDIAKSISNSLADRLVISKVNGQLFDTIRPLEENCTLELLDFDSEDGQQVFWHSSAHVLGEACERHYGCHLCIGPPVEDGFYYEMAIKDRVVSQNDYPQLNTLAKNIIKDKQPFERLEVTKPNLLEMFKHNPYKVFLINDKIPDGTSTTVYRCGPLIDLCRGPHIPHTGRIKAFEVMKNSSSYFLGKAENDSLQRIYGISFPDNAQMKEYLKFKEEADKRDHRRVGKDQQLYFFNELSPGSCFFLPHGARIYNKLIEFMRSEYRKRGFTEVISPNIYNVALWKTSGHWDNYKENMFSFECEHDTYALKPMNCPGHCLMFAHRERSYRELPIRFADFGVLHRNELSGTLGGLTRVRRFQQDDAHIFCRQDQIIEEMKGCLDFLRTVYGIFGFSFNLKLSTRPEKYLGELAVWDKAEKQLEQALNEFGQPWELNPGDGAFYGPKIDITIMDAHKRRHQCATIQLDFQLPIRFNLQYRAGSSTEDSSADLDRPVIIHRAVLGSMERMIAILTENFCGDWPFWLSPRQLIIVPISHTFDEYADSIRQKLHDAGFHAECDLSDLTFNKKIRNAEISQHTFIAVVGAKEAETGTLNLRKAGADGQDVLLSVDEAIAKFKEMESCKTRVNKL